MREARGESPVGRKIGFTNRAVWAHEPMWGYVYDRTIHTVSGGETTLSLAGLVEPRIEPEIVFRLALAPAPAMDERSLLACVDAVAHGFEIVQSIYPGWVFSAPDAVAAYGVHGKLVVGPWQTIAADSDDWFQSLSTFEINLELDGAIADHGHAANVLGGPLTALRHLVGLLARDRVNPSVTAGEIITTGTLTRALPVAPGQTWRTELTGIKLEGMAVRFV